MFLHVIINKEVYNMLLLFKCCATKQARKTSARVSESQDYAIVVRPLIYKQNIAVKKLPLINKSFEHELYSINARQISREIYVKITSKSVPYKFIKLKTTLPLQDPDFVLADAYQKEKCPYNSLIETDMNVEEINMAVEAIQEFNACYMQIQNDLKLDYIEHPMRKTVTHDIS